MRFLTLPPPPTDLKVSDGRLQFQSITNFGAFMKSHTSASDSRQVVNELLSLTEAAGLKSHFMKVNENESSASGRTEEDVLADDIGVSISPEADSIRLTPLVDDRLALVLNENQEIELGDSIYRVQNDYTFIFKKSDKSLLKNFYEDLRDGKVAGPTGYDGLSYGNIKVYKTETKFSNIEYDQNGKTQWETVCAPHGLGDTWQVSARIYEHWSSFYASAGAQVKSNGKRRKCKFLSGCWYTWDVEKPAQILEMKYDMCTYINKVVQGTFNGHKIEYGKSFISVFMGEHAGILMPPIEVKGWVCAKGDLSGETLRCSVDASYTPNYTVGVCNVGPKNCP